MAIVLTIVFLASWSVPYWINRWIVRNVREIERRRLQKPSPPKQEAKNQSDGVFLVAAAGLCPLVLGMLVTPMLRLPLAAVGILLMGIAYLSHLLPGHDRTRKYVLFTCGGSAFSTISLSNTEVPGAFVAVVCVVLLVAVVAMLGYFHATKELAFGDQKLERTITWYRRLTWLQGTDLSTAFAMVILNLLGLSPLYLLARFIVKNQMTRYPIVYLRSFGQAEASIVFPMVILPAVSRYAVVTGLVHWRQGSEILQKDAALLWRSNLFIVPDAHWKSWIASRLDGAAGAIVDISISSEAVLWELSSAIDALGSKRVFVIHSGQREHLELISKLGVTQSQSLADKSASAMPTIDALRNWASDLMQPWRSNRAKRNTATLRYQLPLLFYLYLWWTALDAMVMGGAAVFALPRLREAQVKSAETWARTIRAAIQNWQAASNEIGCPTVETLVREKHLDTETTTLDPWGQPFDLNCTEDEVFVSSWGPDKKKGTRDDIQIPKAVPYPF